MGKIEAELLSLNPFYAFCLSTIINLQLLYVDITKKT